MTRKKEPTHYSSLYISSIGIVVILILVGAKNYFDYGHNNNNNHCNHQQDVRTVNHNNQPEHSTYQTQHKQQPLQDSIHNTNPSTQLHEAVVSDEQFYEKINKFNRRMIHPRLNSLINLEFFKYVKLNLNRPCNLWADADKCNRRDCKVNIYTKCTYDELSFVNFSLVLSDGSENEVIKLFECDYEEDNDAQYIDLSINPERYTGFSGEPAHRIWRAIYEENCFFRTNSPHDMCYEDRLFYEAISGLHSSISIHICAEYPSMALIGGFEPNVVEFKRRFDGHDNYIKNLYSLYLLELRSLIKIENYLMNRVKWPDHLTREAVKNFLSVTSKLDIPQNEKDLFLKPTDISHNIGLHFRNITTTILDCAACDKCKLWGKVQLRGLGTAFKILINNDDNLYLNHQEVVSLMNGFARLSSSIKHLERFKQM